MQRLVLASLLLLSACGAATPPLSRASKFLPSTPPGVEFPRAADSEIIDVADGATVTLTPTRVRKTIAGADVTMYGYNGQIPGPLLRVRQGSTFSVEVKNDIDLPTSVHWHGVRLENANDGAVGVTQDAIAPGGTFRYTVTVPDDGMFWYHPHVREDIQQDLGLYGNLLVIPKNESVYAPVTAELPLFLDDIATTPDGLLPYGDGDADHALMGRFGNAMLVNGASSVALRYARGSVVRFYLTNAANARTFRWSIPGTSMKVVGGDIGRIVQERLVDEVILGPSERTIVDVFFAQSGAYSMHHRGDAVTILGTVEVTDDAAAPAPAAAFPTLRRNADVASSLEAVVRERNRPVDWTLRLMADVEGMQQMGHGMHGGMMMGDGTGIEWEETMSDMNATSSRENTRWNIVDAGSGATNEAIKPTFQKGSVVKLRLRNELASGHPMQHPMHLHGQRFLILSVDGDTPKDSGWKDTVLVPRGSTVDLLVEMSNPGEWMLHCHIAEHLTNGMMAGFIVAA